ncbi:hypothetical protein [Terasakiella pusilla]|jgi:hypothetical protein|nr:hypothetical protein [Terasakiella pusilla]
MQAKVAGMTVGSSGKMILKVIFQKKEAGTTGERSENKERHKDIFYIETRSGQCAFSRIEGSF